MSLVPLLLLSLVAQADPASDEALRRAVRLPVVATELRRDGVPEGDIHIVLQTGREAGMPASETTEVLEATRDAGRKDGHPDNMGAFVRARVQAGLRGRDLADAIHAEHQARRTEREARQAAEGQGPGGPPEHAGRPESPRGGQGEQHGRAEAPEGKSTQPKSRAQDQKGGATASGGGSETVGMKTSGGKGKGGK